MGPSFHSSLNQNLHRNSLKMSEDAAVAEVPPAEEDAASPDVEETPAAPAKKATKAKNPAKAKKPAKPSEHPPFKAMIVSAISELKEKGGSSRQAILKHIVANNKVDAGKAPGQLRLAIKRASAGGIIVSAKDSGKGSGKFLVSPRKTNLKKRRQPNLKP